MDILISVITSLILCNAAAPEVAELRDRLLYELVEVSSSSAECVHLELAVEEIVEDGRIGVVGGIPSSSSLESGACGGLILVVGPAPTNSMFAMAPWVCSEGQNAWTPLTVCGMIACIRLKCGKPFVLKGAASLFF